MLPPVHKSLFGEQRRVVVLARRSTMMLEARTQRVVKRRVRVFCPLSITSLRFTFKGKRTQISPVESYYKQFWRSTSPRIRGCLQCSQRSKVVRRAITALCLESAQVRSCLHERLESFLAQIGTLKAAGFLQSVLAAVAETFLRKLNGVLAETAAQRLIHWVWELSR